MVTKKQRFNSLAAAVAAVLVVIFGNLAFAETINYTYNDLNRLINAKYGNGLIIEYIYDEAGNVVEKLYIDPNDTLPPVTTASPIGGIYNAAQTVTLTCSDAGSGCYKIYYTTDGSTPTASSSVYTKPISIDAATTLQYFARDLVGNIEDVKTQSYIIDIMPFVIINSGVAFTNSASVALTLSCDDGTGSGCTDMIISNDEVFDTEMWEAFNANRDWVLDAGDGTKTVSVMFRNAVGNVSSIFTDDITLDSTAPTGSVVINGDFTQTNSTFVALTLSCDDGTGSGCAWMRLKNSGANWSEWEAFNANRDWVLTNGDGTKTVDTEFQDMAGNISSIYSDGIDLITVIGDSGLTLDVSCPSSVAAGGNLWIKITPKNYDCVNAVSYSRLSYRFIGNSTGTLFGVGIWGPYQKVITTQTVPIANCWTNSPGVGATVSLNAGVAPSSLIGTMMNVLVEILNSKGETLTGGECATNIKQ